MVAEDRQRSLLNRLQKALTDAIMLIVEEQEHHALCYRSISMMQPYAQILPSFYTTHSAHFNDEQKEGVARWLDWVKITLISASGEEARDYQRVKRRSIIVLADIIESIIEVFIATCLEHLDPSGANIKEITGYRKDLLNGGDAKMAVRSWERRLFSQINLRTNRFEFMIKCFFPSFININNPATLDFLIDSRNSLTHDVISLSKLIEIDQPTPTFTAQQIDDFFSVSGDFVLAILKAIPGKLPGKITLLDNKYTHHQ